VQLTDFEMSDAETNQPTPRRFPHSFPWRALLVALVLVGLAFFPLGWSKWVAWQYERVTFAPEEYQATAVSPRIAIVFGARVYSNERLSSMLRDRVDTAIDLYHAGQVDKLLLTGGQNGVEYDEPGAMMAHALERGVPATAMQPDYGGLRTYDSCYRAANIFQVERAVLVTQEFHLPRALLLCDNLGIDVVGVKARLRGQRRAKFLRCLLPWSTWCAAPCLPSWANQFLWNSSSSPITFDLDI
jgi:SanA protein